MTADQPGTEATGAATKAAPAPTEPNAEPGAATTDTNSPPADLSGQTPAQLEERIDKLTRDLALANAESEYFRQQWEELRLRDEALGVEALTVDERKLEDKLVQAVKELYQSEMRRREALQLLDRLLATSEHLLRTAPHYTPESRADYEVASRSAKDYLAGREAGSLPVGLSLTDGQVVDINAGLNAVILNLGKSLGVKEGMPFRVFQNSVQVGTVKVVLARQFVSAALIDTLKPHVVLKVGDRVAVDAEQ